MTEELIRALQCSGQAIGVLMFAFWLLSLLLKDASIVDVLWGLGFVVVAWTSYFVTFDESRPLAGSLLLPCLTTIWGLRLSGYLFWRNHGKPEDFRYEAMRKKWGASFPAVSLLTVFALQGAIMWLVALPVQVGIAAEPENVGWSAAVGVVFWTTGFLFEAIGDWQLAHHKAIPENKGIVLDRGLWRFTRHPNYFGDFLVWWGLFSISFAITGIWWTIVSPIVMSILLMRVSGVTLLERSLKASKPQYSEYVQRTNAFFPGPPRSTTKQHT